jgi:transcriptional regulator with XRE-family HTH domain
MGVRTFDPDALRRVLAAQNLSVQGLSGRLGAVRQNVSDWRHGRHRPSPATLRTLAAELDVPPQTLTTTRQGTERLYDLRVWAGLTQQQVAARLELRRDAYRAVEHGTRPLSPRLLPRLADVVGQDLDATAAALRRTLSRPEGGGAACTRRDRAT